VSWRGRQGRASRSLADGPVGVGGDTFDLADVGMTHARYVRIRDVSFRGGAPTEGSDVDTAVILNADIL